MRQPLEKEMSTLCAALVLLASAALPPSPAADARLRVAVRYPASLEKGPLDGRLLLFLSTDGAAEPRFQVRDSSVAKSQQVFGIDVDGWKPGEEAVFDAGALGYPAESLADVKPGTYRVQALLHRYETFRRADGHVVTLPMDRGEGQQWNRAPGNLFSSPREVFRLEIEVPELGYQRTTLLDRDALDELLATDDVRALVHERLRGS